MDCGNVHMDTNENGCIGCDDDNTVNSRNDIVLLSKSVCHFEMAIRSLICLKPDMEDFFEELADEIEHSCVDDDDHLQRDDNDIVPEEYTIEMVLAITHDWQWHHTETDIMLRLHNTIEKMHNALALGIYTAKAILLSHAICLHPYNECHSKYTCGHHTGKRDVTLIVHTHIADRVQVCEHAHYGAAIFLRSEQLTQSFCSCN